MWYDAPVRTRDGIVCVCVFCVLCSCVRACNVSLPQTFVTHCVCVCKRVCLCAPHVRVHSVCVRELVNFIQKAHCWRRTHRNRNLSIFLVRASAAAFRCVCVCVWRCFGDGPNGFAQRTIARDCPSAKRNSRFDGRLSVCVDDEQQWRASHFVTRVRAVGFRFVCVVSLLFSGKRHPPFVDDVAECTLSMVN